MCASKGEKKPPPLMHTWSGLCLHAHMVRFMPAYTHGQVYACMHTWSGLCLHAHMVRIMPACTHGQVYACMHTWSGLCLHARMVRFMPACTHGQVYACMHTWSGLCLHAHMVKHDACSVSPSFVDQTVGYVCGCPHPLCRGTDRSPKLAKAPKCYLLQWHQAQAAMQLVGSKARAAVGETQRVFGLLLSCTSQGK